MAFHVSCCTHWAFLGYSWGISGILDGIIPGHSWGIHGIPIDLGANLTVINLPAMLSQFYLALTIHC